MEKQISKAILQGYAAKLEGCLECDVAIVGGGPSGLLCARLLAQAGKNVAVFEKKLAPGGGAWGGAMLFNDVVIQDEAVEILEDLGVRHEKIGDGLVRADSVELASCLIYQAVHSGAKIFNGVAVEDVVYKADRVAGVVINYTPILLAHLHVDPLAVQSKAVLDGTGHHADLTALVAKKAGLKLDTPTGGLLGERPMDAEEGERATVENTRRVYPGLYVSGMAANGVFGSARMGPIFGGMLLSGRRAAEIILKDL